MNAIINRASASRALEASISIETQGPASTRSLPKAQNGDGPGLRRGRGRAQHFVSPEARSGRCSR